MEVTVVCYGALRERIGGSRQSKLELGPRSDVNAVMTELGIDPRHVFQILVNEDQAARDRGLEEGDTVTLMPPFTGG